MVSLAIFDLSGRMVTELLPKAVLSAGPHELVWRGTDAAGQPVASGVYFCRMESEGFRAAQKMILLK